MVFTVANLKYLIASGRVPRLQGVVGDLLNIKPIILTTDGVLEPVARVRTHRKAVEHVLDLIVESFGSGPVRLAAGHCNVPEEAAELAEQAKQRLDVRELIVFDLGMLAALGGPGLVGLTGYRLEGAG
jgi:DegV family protein with EDD domain